MKKFLVVLICFLVALFLSVDKRAFRENSSNDVFRVDIAGVHDKTSIDVSSEEANVKIPTWCKDCAMTFGNLSKVRQNATWSVQAKKSGQVTIRLMGPYVVQDNKHVPVYVAYKNLVVDGALVLAGPVVVFHDKPYNHTIDVKAGQKIEFSVMPEKTGVASYWKTLHVRWYMLVLYFGGLLAVFAIFKKLLKKKSN